MEKKIFTIDKKDFERQKIYLDEDYRWNFLLHTDTKEFNVYKRK